MISAATPTFDRKFYEQDIRGSRAHAAMLCRQGILTEEEGQKIDAGLRSILADVQSGKLMITEEYEDIHSFVEAVLTERIGEAGKKLHTGRSRNDQVALDMKLYVRDEIDAIQELLYGLLETILSVMYQIEYAGNCAASQPRSNAVSSSVNPRISASSLCSLHLTISRSP